MKEKEKTLMILNCLYTEIEKRIKNWNITNGNHDTVSINKIMSATFRWRKSDYDFELKKLKQDFNLGKITRHDYIDGIKIACNELRHWGDILNISEEIITIQSGNFKCSFPEGSLVSITRKYEVMCNITAMNRRHFVK